MNLCLNARDAMPTGGTLMITAKNVVLSENFARANPEAHVGNYIAVKVFDTGIGMTPAVSTRIFEPFFTTKEIDKGTGLGLSTALSIVKSHGGLIDVSSKPNGGTGFSMYLPTATDQADDAAKQIAAAHPTGNGELILIVDDEENIRQATGATLEKFGYQVLTAVDGIDALAIYTEHRSCIALVLTDLMMPLMDGAATIRVLRKLDPALKIIAASGLMTSEQTAELQTLNVNAALTKPFTAEKLLTTLRDVLKQN